MRSTILLCISLVVAAEAVNLFGIDVVKTIKDAGNLVKEGIKVETHLKIINHSNKDIIDTEASNLSNFDWPKDNRPDRNFQHIPIPSGASHTAPADLRTVAKRCPFSMTLTFSDGTKSYLRANQKYVFNGHADFSHSSHNRRFELTKDKRTFIITVYDK